MSQEMEVVFDAEKAKFPYITDAQMARELVARGLKYDKLLASKRETEEMYNPSDLPEAWS